METVLGILALVVLVGVLLVSLGVTIAALLFGHRFSWLWFTLAVFELVSKIGSVALYRESDTIRGLVSLGGAIVAAVLALLLQRKFGSVVMVLGGFLGGGLIAIQFLGPLLNPAPEWLVFILLAAAGAAGAVWARLNPQIATNVLSALVGAGIFTQSLVGLMNIDEAHRFQVLVVLALAGIAFQSWMRRRRQQKEVPSTVPQGA